MSVRALPSVRSVTEPVRVTVEDLEHGGDLPRALKPRAAPKRASRSEVQIKIDDRVAEVYQRWMDEGRESVWIHCPHAYYAVPEAKVKDMRDKIRKAGRLLRVQIKFGRADLYDAEGNVMVTFTVVDLLNAQKKRRPRKQRQAVQTKPRGICSVCQQPAPVRLDGTVWQHKGCPGGNLPAQQTG